MPKGFYQSAATTAKDEDVALKRIAAEALLYQQWQSLHALTHVAVTARDPHPHSGTDQDHLRARMIAAASSDGAAEPILTFTSFGKSTAMTSSIASLRAASTSLACTKAGLACWTKD